jgi:hypothetical protein
LESLEDDLHSLALSSDDRVRREVGIDEPDPADVGTADTVQRFRGKGAVAARSQGAFVHQQDAEAARAGLRVGTRQHADQVTTGGVVDQPLLAVQPVPVGARPRRDLVGQQVTAVVAFGQPPRHHRTLRHLRAQPAALLRRAPDPYRCGAQECLAVADRHRQVPPGDHPEHLQGVVVPVQHTAGGDRDVVRRYAEEVQLPADVHGELLAGVQRCAPLVGEDPPRIAWVSEAVVEGSGRPEERMGHAVLPTRADIAGLSSW